MEFLKNVFGDKTLTFAEFSQAVEADEKIKLINLADGGYVAKEKLDKKITELSEAQATIETLKGNGEDVEKLRQTISDYEAKEKNRADAEAKAKELKAQIIVGFLSCLMRLFQGATPEPAKFLSRQRPPSAFFRQENALRVSSFPYPRASEWHLLY